MAACSSGRLLMLVIGILVGCLPGIFIGFSSKLTYNIDATVQHQDCIHTPPKSEEPTSNLLPIADTQRQPVAHTSWCPNAECHNTDLCHPCQRRFLIVIATARSASTTLTWMLNELPGIRMSGENNNHLDSIWQMQNNLWNHSSFHKGNEKKTAWGHNYIPRQNFACAAQATVEAINPPPLVNQQFLENKDSEKAEIIGFKTIRFDRGADKNYTAMVEMVKMNFPCSRIIININSNVKRQAESFKAANFFHLSEKRLEERNNDLRNVQKLFGDDTAFLVDSAQWTNNVEVLNDAVEWMGFHKSCRFQELLEFNTAGGHGFQNGRQELSNRDPQCQAIE